MNRFHIQILLLAAIVAIAVNAVSATDSEEDVIVECFDCPHQRDFDIDLVDVEKVEDFLCVNQLVRNCEEKCIPSNDTDLRKSLMVV